jgi:hypothetical protein
MSLQIRKSNSGKKPPRRHDHRLDIDQHNNKYDIQRDGTTEPPFPPLGSPYGSAGISGTCLSVRKSSSKGRTEAAANKKRG